MAIVISGINNNDKITATDGLIDVLSGVSFNSEVTVPSFKVGSNIQLGNAGVATATTFVGNLTGNVNATSNLLLQIGGSEKFRVGSSGQLGIAGANYGTSGQVLTSGGSGSAATWSTITGTTINNQSDNRMITCTGTSNTLNAEQYLTYTSQSSLNLTDGNGTSILGGNYLNLKRTTGNTNYINAPLADAELVISADEDIIFRTVHTADFNSTERLRIDSTGRLLLGSGAANTPKITGPGGLDVSQYGLSICMGGSSGSSGQARANATTKEARLVIPHYTNAEEPLTAIAAFSTSSYNYINYGGGTSLGNVATRHQFYTAANTTTTGGSEKLKIEHTGVRSYVTFVDTSYHANPDPLGDGSGIAYYRLNNNFQDSGRFGNHGQGIQGGDPTFALVNSSGEPCWNNPADGAINLPNLKNSYPFSMAAWINMQQWSTSVDNDVIMNLSIGGQRVTLSVCCFSSAPSDGMDFYIMYGGTGHHYFRPSSRPTNTWIHVVYSVVSSNNTAHRVYQNGADLTTRGNRGGGHGGSAGWAMGGNAANSERLHYGRIGSIRFFNKALSSSEASALYTNDTFYT